MSECVDCKCGIRKGEPADIEAMSLLWLDMCKELTPDMTPKVEWWVERAKEFMAVESYEVFVAEKCGEIVGFVDGMAVAEPATGKIHGTGFQFYVAPKYRNTSIAHKLFANIVRAGMRKGIDLIEVFCYGNEKQMWSKRGFRTEGLLMRR